MYLHLGNNTGVDSRRIIVILDISAEDKKRGIKEFLQTSIRRFNILIGNQEVKSCIVTDQGVFLSSIAAPTLYRRLYRPLMQIKIPLNRNIRANIQR